jgi:S-adenosylmethionine synthetase
LEIVDFSTDYSKNPYWFNPRGIEDLPEYNKLFANDTSSVVSYWGLSSAESLALKLEGYFYKGIGIPKFDDIGQDIKVMIVREFNNYDITLAVPFFVNKLINEARYWERKDQITKELISFAMKELPEDANINLSVNTQDQGKDRTVENNIRSFYFVTAGSALDYGEEGFVGRGNNRLGIISSGRPYTMEAAAGKNPVYHVGKVLGVVADEMTKELSKQASGDFEVWLMARNGDPLLAPNKVIVNHNSEWDDAQIDKVVRSVLDKNNWTERILKEELLVPTPLITK